MRKLREVLRLRFELKLGYQQIGRSCSIGVGTVHKYLKRAEAAGLTWPLPEPIGMKPLGRQCPSRRLYRSQRPFGVALRRCC